MIAFVTIWALACGIGLLVGLVLYGGAFILDRLAGWLHRRDNRQQLRW